VNYLAVLSSALSAPYSAERPSGCGRVYVCVSKEHAKGIKAAAKKLGKIFQSSSHYGDKYALYVGYDNCDGKALGQGSAIVASLKSAGIPAYRNEHGD
jgi:hypothetical protein